jgi:hypothetical protein
MVNKRSAKNDSSPHSKQAKRAQFCDEFPMAPKSPKDIASHLAQRDERFKKARLISAGSWRRETFRLPRQLARAKAQEWFRLYPKAAYMTEIEQWQECDNDDIEFTMRRLPSAD